LFESIYRILEGWAPCHFSISFYISSLGVSYLDFNQNDGGMTVTSVDRVNLIWILMKESVFASSCAILVSLTEILKGLSFRRQI
jgi:hypothetical protein